MSSSFTILRLGTVPDHDLESCLGLDPHLEGYGCMGTGKGRSRAAAAARIE